MKGVRGPTVVLLATEKTVIVTPVPETATATLKPIISPLWCCAGGGLQDNSMESEYISSRVSASGGALGAGKK